MLIMDFHKEPLLAVVRSTPMQQRASIIVDALSSWKELHPIGLSLFFFLAKVGHQGL